MYCKSHVYPQKNGIDIDITDENETVSFPDPHNFE